MIAEHVQRQGEGYSFKKLAAYVTDEPNQGRGDPTSWKLADYIFDAQHKGRKVERIRVTNCKGVDPGWAVKECTTLAAQNTRSKRDKSFHLVVSFPEGEKPTPEQMIDIEDEVVRAIGLQDHKRISATHTNTPNFHVHIAICTVHPVTLRNVTPYYSHFRLQEVCQALELKHGLRRDNHSRTPERPLNGKANELRVHADRVAFAAWIREQAGAAVAKAGRDARTWQDLHQALSAYGLVIKPRGAGLVIAHRDNDRIRVKASEVDRMLSLNSLMGRLGAYQTPGPELPKPEQVYVSQVPQSTPEQAALWARYKAEQDALAQRRTLAMAELRLKQADYAERLSEWYHQRYRNALARRPARADLTRTFHTLARDRRQDNAKRRAQEKQDRDALMERYRGISWTEFLEREAFAGNPIAARSLNRKIERAPDLHRDTTDYRRGADDSAGRGR